MDSDLKFWRVLDYVRFAEFSWGELVLMALGASALGAYFLLAVLLERRQRTTRRRAVQTHRVEEWLRRWNLAPEELAQIKHMAGGERPTELYRMLAEPVRFERAVHRAFEGGELAEFTAGLRQSLGYTSHNLRIPMVSTRQLVPGDHFRLAHPGKGRPQSQYGQVIDVTHTGFTLEFTEEGFAAVRRILGGCSLFMLRGYDVEYRFGLQVRGMDAVQHRLILGHTLTEGSHRPRGARLPIVRPVNFTLERAAGVTDGGVTETQRPIKVRGVLLEMSEGGFSWVSGASVPPGSFVAFTVPRPRYTPIVVNGRVLDCQPFSGQRHLVRCEMRGQSRTERTVLGHILRAEQQRRLNRLREERRKRAAAP